MVRLAADGRVEVCVSSTDFGQGTSTVLTQIVADAVGVTPASIVMAPADTSVVPDSGPTVASRTVMVVGGILERAGRRLADELCVFAARERGVSDVSIHDGTFVDGAGRELASFEEIARAHGALEIVEHFEADSDDEFDESTYRGAAYSAYGWSANVIEVDVDSDTLAVNPRSATLVTDVARRSTQSSARVRSKAERCRPWATATWKR